MLPSAKYVGWCVLSVLKILMMVYWVSEFAIDRIFLQICVELVQQSAHLQFDGLLVTGNPEVDDVLALEDDRFVIDSHRATSYCIQQMIHILVAQFQAQCFVGLSDKALSSLPFKMRSRRALHLLQHPEVVE